MEIWLRQEGVEYGPYTLAQVKEYVDNGEVTMEDEAWFDGCEDYVTVGDIPNFTSPRKIVRKGPRKRKVIPEEPRKKKNPIVIASIVVSSVLLVAGLSIGGFYIQKAGSAKKKETGDVPTPATRGKADSTSSERSRRQATVTSQSFLGIYEYSEDNKDWVYRFVLKEGGRYQAFANGLEMEGGTWKVVGKEVHVLDHKTDIWAVYIANANGDLTGIGSIQRGDREDYPTKDQDISKKIKTETPLKTFKAPKEEDVVGIYTQNHKDEEGAEILEKLIFLKNGSRDRYVNAEKAEYTYPGVPTPVAKWKIKGSEIWVTHVFTTIYKLEQNGDLTEVANVIYGQLTPNTKKERTTYKKIKSETKEKNVQTNGGDGTPLAKPEPSGVDAKPVEEIMLEHSGYVNSVTFSRDGKWVVSGSYDGTIGIRDAESGKQIRLLKDAEGVYSAVAISPDGKRIVSGSDDRKVKIWDAESGKKLKTLSGHRGEVFSVALDANASRIVSGSGDGTIKIWDSKSGEEIRTLTGHGDDVKSVAFSPDGKRVVSGGDDNTAKIWDAGSGKLLKTFDGHTSTVDSVAFIHGGKRILSLSPGFGLQIKIWDAESGEVLKDLKTIGGFVFCVAMSPDGKRIVYGCGTGEVIVMEAESGKVLKKYEEHELAVESVAISADGKRFVSGGADSHTYIHAF